MHKLVTALALSGLAISAGPLSLGAQAQGYVDLEAERASSKQSDNSTQIPPVAQPTYQSAPQSAPQSQQAADPYSSKPASEYPAVSYGLNSSAAPAVPPPVARTPAGGQTGDQNLGNLFYQLQQLQQEVMMLNGKVEEQAHELRRLKGAESRALCRR